MLFLLKTCHKFKARRDLESKTEQLLHSEMTPTTQQTQLLQFQLQFLKKELGTSFSHNMDDECKKLIHRITPPSCIHNCPRHSLEFITIEGQIFLLWKHLKLGTSLVSKLYIQHCLAACSKLCLTGGDVIIRKSRVL
ncbi:uncharacterized protein [Malus domestica]|uniref:uncharacterized protein isoform X7 n=1 Tax=Malus domestica TaxID=3750 RepID=UPI0010A9D8D1|nr:uncharacterized protein LOC103418314 isoform X3 [Malus domestica]XP_028947207.1 uncharacterized protein LOC103418314 isoform X3 [Malus domestica]XP_028947211.1 uncharacterized protein LOC103418314 isoform X3 [Malus domestica]